MLDFTTIVIFLVLLLLGYWLLKKPSKLPPGPGISAFLQLTFRKDPKPETLLREWMTKYKDISSFTFGSTPVVFIYSYDMMKEVFIQNADNFSNRPSNMWLLNQLSNQKGIIFNPTTWKSTRKLALHTMRDFGLGKHSIDERIQDEARLLVKEFRSKTGQAFDPLDDITKAVSNIICSITFGKRYTYNDEEFADVLQKLEAYFKSDFHSSILNSFPFLRHFSFLFERLSLDYFMKNVNAIRQFIQREIDIHKETFDPDNQRDLIDIYIQAEKNDFKDMKGIDEQQLFQTILDLFLAGTETTTNTLRWLLMYLINNPDVQKKCHQEISQVLGDDNLPEYRDRNNFPYTVATIQETIRLKTVALGTLPHVADKTIEIAGHTIPKGSIVVGITMGLMIDPKIWGEDVDAFRPDRWLDENGDLRIIPEFLPFGLGRRACIGEELAKTELFIKTVALLQKLSFQFEDPENPPKVEGTAKLTYVPHPFKIVPVCR